ncbi:MAG: hypothetical protein J6S76_01245 [Clostridia bacterium]|nr:hypothetical protein [Clostridia bacterium]
MPAPQKERFIAALLRTPHAQPTLFEPFIHPAIAEQLIWRRGPQLWDTPEHYVDTMVSLRERTQADIVVLDARTYCPRTFNLLLAAAEARVPAASGCVILCQSQTQITACAQSPIVCAVGGYGDTHPTHHLPFIRMDGDIRGAIAEGAVGWFASDGAETYFSEHGSRITVCGGLGAQTLAAAEPLAIHRRVEALLSASANGCGYLIGSGGTVDASAYLSLISMLGIYIRHH